MNTGFAYNERSWAIDLIGHIKQVVAANNRTIKDAGGEQTVRAQGGMLFPDVLLFGDSTTARILQGWELKMPDTSIDDHEFRQNAEKKARALGLDSFVLWNVSHARLYVKSSVTNIFSSAKQWDSLSHITSRNGVVPNRAAWEALAAEIVSYVNDLFDRGSLEGRRFIDAYKSGGITSLIMENSGMIAEALRCAARQDARFKAEMVLWWSRSQSEYTGTVREMVLAQAIISNWIGKFLFAHILQGQDSRAQAVTQITDEFSPSDALEVFRQLSQECNFWTIFSDSVGLTKIPAQPWDQLKQLNKLLTDLRIGSIDQSQLSEVLEATVETAVRKIRGQYLTPSTLARLLVHLCVCNVEEDRVLDPCCGSGTISRAALEQKLEAGVEAKAAAASVFAGDIDAQAIQIATFAMAKPSLIHMALRLFLKDAFLLEPNTEIEFRNPTNGEVFTEKLGKFDAIASNLPFVSQDGRGSYSDAISRVSLSLEPSISRLSGRADVAAYLPFALYPLLEDKGRLGIIITNAWLGTAWGDAFFAHLRHHYILKSVITSGAGRWFQNSKVVTNILILEKKGVASAEDEAIDFVVLTRPLEELSDPEALSVAAAQIELGRTQNETMTIHSLSVENLARFRRYGLGGNAQFVNCDWVLELPLVPLRTLFSIRRGERRGWDKMFYPKGRHGIEEEYIRPVLKSSTEISGLIAFAQAEAFSCSRTVEELRELGHTGALSWIDRFKDSVDNKGKLLSLSKVMPGLRWYEMRADNVSDLVMPLNYGNRLYVARLNTPSFVNQRLISLNARAGLDIDLCHALLNSTISLFIIEGMGFGRGQGVLDLNKDQVEGFTHCLDPNRLEVQEATAIKMAFRPLLQRNVLEVADELEQEDRQNFDDVVVKVFNLSVSRSQIYESLTKLISIRQAATQNYS